MEIVKSKENEKLTVQVIGRLDTTTSPELEKELADSLSGITELIFDMKDLEYISSAGLRVLLSTQKKMNKTGNMVLRNCSGMVMEVFDVTGFVDILSIE